MPNFFVLVHFFPFITTMAHNQAMHYMCIVLLCTLYIPSPAIAIYTLDFWIHEIPKEFNAIILYIEGTRGIETMVVFNNMVHARKIPNTKHLGQATGFSIAPTTSGIDGSLQI